MLSTQTVRSLASLGAVCILRLPCPMVALSPLGYDGLPSLGVREAEAPRCSTWTSAEIVPFCSLIFPPVPFSLPGIGRAVDTKSSPPTLALLECLGGVAQLLLNQSMQTVFHECSAHLVQSETVTGGWGTPQVARRRCPAMPSAHIFEKPLGDRVGYESMPAGCRLPLVVI